MNFIYDDVDVDTTKISDKEMTIHCLKAKEFQLRVGYKKYENAKKRLVENKAEKRFMDDKQLMEHEGKRALGEGLLTL